MNLPRSIRVLIALAILVLALAVLLLVLTISEATLNIRAHLSQAAWWWQWGWWSIIALIGVGAGWIVWRLIAPRSGGKATVEELPESLNEEQLESDLRRAEDSGIDISEAAEELRQLRTRRSIGAIQVALFGEVSTGKSALINALLPDAEAKSDIRGGTTRSLQRYVWHSPGGDELQITDMPGTDEAAGTLDAVAEDEAKRAHIVIYVTDGDLNRQQHERLRELMALRKPMILALNKTDRYSEQEIAVLSERLRSYLQGSQDAIFARVTAAVEREVIVQRADGTEKQERRQIPPQVSELGVALQRLVDRDPALLERLRDSATFVLVKRKLDDALARDRRVKAEKLVNGFSIKAVIGALAAITPGTDLLIQGWLGTQLVRRLGELYGIPVRKVDTDLLLELVQRHVGKAHTLLLAVAGNAFKAFPGVGTLAGGALHAVAYGIIFRTLGHALITTLETRGELHPRQTAKLFEENLGEDLESSARSLARVVVEQSRADERKD